jgi:hypothetical protein
MITIKTRNLEKVKQFIDTLPRNIRGEAAKEAGIYLIGNDRRGLKHYPARVQHGEFNPYQWQSDKQRKAYFASNGFGKGIPYSRSNSLKGGWHQIGGGVNTQIVNNVPYAGYVVDADQQRGHAADKWRLVSDVIASNIAGMFQSINRVLQRWINRNEPG